MPAGLFEELNASGIRYCEWKSTHDLDKGLRGGTDLDMLVHREDAARFREILLRCDYKPFVSAAQRQYPAVEDYVGFDPVTGALSHLHVFYRLLIGDLHTKNFMVPVEESFLNNTRFKSGVRVPTPELEIMVLALRVLLKYRDRDAIKDIIKYPGRGGVPASLLKELDGLLKQTDLGRIRSSVEQHADFIPPQVIVDFLNTIQRSPRDGLALFRLRRQARQALAPFRRQGFGATLTYLRTMFIHQVPSNRLRNFLLANRHKRPAAGGLGIAFIGTDGAGKSTSVKQIAKWLTWRMNVYVFYMGTTHPSAAAKIARGVASAGQLVHAGFGRVLGKGNAVTRATKALAQILTDLRYIAEGNDRYNRYLAAQRRIAQGGVVVFDRYPLQAVNIDGRAMDGPRIAVSRESEGTLHRRLARAEEKIYKSIRPPDHILLLRVRPQVSLARKPEHAPERIEAKSQALATFAQNGLNVTEVDAEQPLDQVLLEIKSAIWGWL